MTWDNRNIFYDNEFCGDHKGSKHQEFIQNVNENVNLMSKMQMGRNSRQKHQLMQGHGMEQSNHEEQKNQQISRKEYKKVKPGMLENICEYCKRKKALFTWFQWYTYNSGYLWVQNTRLWFKATLDTSFQKEAFFLVTLLTSLHAWVSKLSATIQKLM